MVEGAESWIDGREEGDFAAELDCDEEYLRSVMRSEIQLLGMLLGNKF